MYLQNQMMGKELENQWRLRIKSGELLPDNYYLH